MGTLARTLVAAVAVCGAAGPALADEPKAPAADAPGAGAPAGDDWHFRLAPYLWMAALEGDVATLSGLPTVDVDASFSDILEDLDLALMLAGELRYRRAGLLLDLAYLDLSTDESTPGPLFGEVELETRTFFATLAPFYRALDAERGVLDLFAGMRVWSIDTELVFEPGLLARRETDDDETWVDPLVGARGSLRLLDSLSVSAAGDVGGFGAASESTWQLLGTLDFRAWERVAIRAGYRHLEVDYDHGGFVWDVALSGPIVGVAIDF